MIAALNVRIDADLKAALDAHPGSNTQTVSDALRRFIGTDAGAGPAERLDAHDERLERVETALGIVAHDADGR